MCVVDFFAIAPAYVELMFDGEGGGLGAEDPARRKETCAEANCDCDNIIRQTSMLLAAPPCVQALN